MIKIDFNRKEYEEAQQALIETSVNMAIQKEKLKEACFIDPQWAIEEGWLTINFKMPSINRIIKNTI